MHALTGCDTTSSFFGIGKRTAFLALKTMDKETLQKLSNLHLLPIKQTVEIVSTYLAAMYDPKIKSKAARNCVNSLRYSIAKEKNAPINKLPPSQASLVQHILRSSWQLNEWSQATSAKIQSLNPTNYRWLEINGTLCPNYFEGDTAIEYLEKFFCNCGGKTPCTRNSCSCKQLNINCCDVCMCAENCQNDKDKFQ
ncbi:hypothetical protein ALC57_00053 [Trachymyrmex cornetzi]|uniref:CRC domain-containing protein n=1 Tax=Trachymyrmex cornetzi TaxID=471704 RepID=A0A151K2S0_9HYME|nr:hypothetical protein ALC57_00053 [Trachymyrmex cornetzi]